MHADAARLVVRSLPKREGAGSRPVVRSTAGSTQYTTNGLSSLKLALKRMRACVAASSALKADSLTADVPPDAHRKKTVYRRSEGGGSLALIEGTPEPRRSRRGSHRPRDRPPRPTTNHDCRRPASPPRTPGLQAPSTGEARTGWRRPTPRRQGALLGAVHLPSRSFLAAMSVSIRVMSSSSLMSLRWAATISIVAQAIVTSPTDSPWTAALMSPTTRVVPSKISCNAAAVGGGSLGVVTGRPFLLPAPSGIECATHRRPCPARPRKPPRAH